MVFPEMTQNSPLAASVPKRRSADILRDMVNSDRAIYGQNAVDAYPLQIGSFGFRDKAANKVLKSDRFPQPFSFRDRSRKAWLFDLKMITDFQAIQQRAAERAGKLFAVTVMIKEGIARKAITSPRGSAAYFSKILQQQIKHYQRGEKGQNLPLMMSLSIEGEISRDPSRLHAHMAITAHDEDMKPGGCVWTALRSVSTKEKSSLRIKSDYKGGPITVGWARYMAKHNPRKARRYYCSPAIVKESIEIHRRGCEGRRFIRKLNRAATKREVPKR